MCIFVAVTIPDGIHETSSAENGIASPEVEDATQNETATTTDTGGASCREDEVQMAGDANGDNEMTESGGQETVEDDNCTSQQRCVTSSEVPASSEVGSDCNVDRDSSRNDDDLASSDPITDGEMKASFQDGDDEKAGEDDRPPSDAVAEKTEANDCRPNEAETFSHNTASEMTSAETVTGVAAEEDDRRVGHGMLKHLLDSDTDDHNEKVFAQEQSTEEDELSGNEQPIQQNARDTGEACEGKTSVEESVTSRAGVNENALDDSAGRAVTTNEYVVDESSDEETDGDSISRGTREVVENYKELPGNEETEQRPENVPEQTSELLQSLDGPAPETGTRADCRSERNVQTPETPTEDDKTQQQLTQYTTNGKSGEESYHQDENVEQQLLVNNGTVEQNATEKNEERTAISADACSRRSSESDKSTAEPAAVDTQSTEEQILQPTEASVGKQGLTDDSVQPTDSKQNGASEPVEQAEVSTPQTSCNQSIQGHSTNHSECINEQSLKNSGEHTESEYNYTSTKNTEENVEVTEMEGKSLRLPENNDSNQRQTTEEAETAQNQRYAANKDNNAAQKSAASDANTKEVQEGTDVVTNKLVEKSDDKFDERVEETSGNHSPCADEIRSISAANTVGQSDDNVVGLHDEEVDRNFQRGSGQSPATSDTIQCEPHGVDYGSAQKESHSGQEAQQEAAQGSEHMQDQANDINEASETREHDDGTELRTDNTATEMVGEESVVMNSMSEKLAGEEMTTIGETVDNTECRNSADIAEQQNKQTEPATENECQPVVTSNSEESNEAVMTANELVADISKEEVSDGTNQPRERSVSPESPEELENELKSENAVDESSAVNNDMCETSERAVEEAQQQEMTDESQPQQSTGVTETATEQPERDVSVESKIHPDTETTENSEENDNNEPRVENRNEHRETDSPGTDEVGEQPVDASETSEDHASSTVVASCDKNATEPESETQAVAAGEDSVTQSAKQCNDSCASDTRDGQSTEVSETADNTRAREAALEQQDTEENEPSMADGVEATKERPETTADDEQVGVTQSALNNVGSDVAEETDSNVANEHNLCEDKNTQDVQYQSNEADELNETRSLTFETENAEVTTDPVQSQTKTSPQVEIAASCNGTVESITFASDDVYEVRKTDKVSQQDSGIIVCGESEETSNYPAEKDYSEHSQLINGHDDPVNSLNPAEKHQSIRTYIDGYRDIELSGMKLATYQVGRRSDRLLHSVVS